MIYPHIPSALRLVSRGEGVPLEFPLLVLHNKDEAQLDNLLEDDDNSYIAPTEHRISLKKNLTFLLEI